MHFHFLCNHHTLVEPVLFFQADIVAADERLLRLGLVFAADMDVSLEEQPEYYSFHHKLIQEHLAARYLTQKVKKDREAFGTAFSDWEKDIGEGPHREVLKFMVGMDASIMEHVCRTYADYMTTEPHDIDLSELTDLQKQAVSSGTASQNSASPIAVYDSDPDQEILSLPIRQALLSAHLVLVDDVDVEDLPISVKTEKNEICQHHTRALLMEDCSYDVVQHVMESIQGIPITHLYMDDCGKDVDSDSDSDEGNVSRKLYSWFRKGIKSINIGSSKSECCTNIANDSLTLCRQAQGIYMKDSTLPIGQLRQLCQQLKGCLQLHTFCMEEVNIVLPNCSVTDHLPNKLLKVVCRGLRHLNKLQIIRLGGNPLGEHGKYITQAINTWQPEPQLRELHLEDCKLPSKVTGGLLKALATRCNQLEKLVLGDNDLGGQLTALTSHTHPLLKQLCLEKCILQSVDGHALADAIQQHRLPQLEVFNLDGNDLGGHLAALASHTPPLLRQLCLENCNLQLADGHALAVAIQHRLPQFEWLILKDNPSLGEEATAAILTAAHTHHQGKMHVDLDHIYVSIASTDKKECDLSSVMTEGVLRVLAAGACRLENLSLSNYDLGGQLAALTSHTYPLLKKLKIRGCNLQPADGHALADAIQQHRLPQLEELDLKDNPSLSEAEAAILTAALTHHQRELRIQLDYCGVEIYSTDLQKYNLPLIVKGGILQVLATGCNRLKDLQLYGKDLSGQVAALTTQSYPLLRALQFGHPYQGLVDLWVMGIYGDLL